ncbi:hypothetical protein CYMTET_47103 [Cymbomonas tetramitiformis]|uniref:Uncharacterized protein n=1 Tax=Cymbomonas tetramitiformis TaxID=36881 RepID=A0AAE0EWX5_9CHLO|nr:hypothetical protein CYMTET_47103 [Cymbomonas tetramitiformis]
MRTEAGENSVHGLGARGVAPSVEDSSGQKQAHSLVEGNSKGRATQLGASALGAPSQHLQMPCARDAGQNPAIAGRGPCVNPGQAPE